MSVFSIAGKIASIPVVPEIPANPKQQQYQGLDKTERNKLLKLQHKAPDT
jgi:hypothetical protein